MTGKRVRGRVGVRIRVTRYQIGLKLPLGGGGTRVGGLIPLLWLLVIKHGPEGGVSGIRIRVWCTPTPTDGGMLKEEIIGESLHRLMDPLLLGGGVEGEGKA